MAQIRTYKKKIKTAKNIAKITRAMQLVAASKMKKAQNSALAGKEYADGVHDLSSLLSRYYNEDEHKLVKKMKDGKDLVVLIAPEKGLCGALVTNLTKYLINNLSEGSKRSDDFLVIGKKAKQIAGKLGVNIIADFPLGIASPKYEMVPPIAKIIEDRFVNGENARVIVFYSEFINTMEQEPTKRTLLPLVLNEVGNVGDKPLEESDFKFEPSIQNIANPLFEMYLEIETYQILLEAYASEQSARMIAMKNATDNAKSLIDELTVEFNKARQATITNELLDIQNAVNIIS